MADAVQETCSSEMLGGQGADFLRRGDILEHQIFRFAKVIVRDRCSTSYDLASLFRGRRSTLDRWSGKFAKRIGTRPSALHLTFQYWRKSRRIASFLMLSTSKMEEVSYNSLVFDVVTFKHWGNLAEIAAFLTLSTSKIEEVSQNSFVFQACRWHYTMLHHATVPSTTTTTATIQIQIQELHYTNYTTLRYNCNYDYNHNCNYNYTTLQYATLITLHYNYNYRYNYNYTTSHYTRLHYTILRYNTLHYNTLHDITLHKLQHPTTTTTTTTALHHTTSSRCGWGDHCNHCNHSKKNTTPTTFRSISDFDFALPYMHHNNLPLL